MRNIAKSIIKFAEIPLFLGLFWVSPTFAYALSPTLSFAVTPQTLTAGETATMSWFADNVSSCKISGPGQNGFPYPPSFSVSVSPAETSSYYVVCNGPNGFVSDAKTIFVNQRGLPSPTVIYSATQNYNASNPGLIPIPTPPIPIASSANMFAAACATSLSVTETNKIVSFAAAQTGGFAPLVYRWSGDISGSQQVENIAFEHVGVKTAKITVTDSRGLSAEGTCSVAINPPASFITPTATSAATAKKPTVVVAETNAPTCKTVTLCIDTSGNVIQKDDGAIKKDEPKIETAQNGNGSNGKKFFLASLFGSGNGNGNGNGSGTARNFIVYLLPIFAAACIIFIGYMVVKMSKRA